MPGPGRSRAVADSVLVAVDGSPSAQAAVTYLTANRMLAGRPVEVLAVASGLDRPESAPLSVVSDLAFDSFEKGAAERRHAEDHRRQRRRAAARRWLSRSLVHQRRQPAHEIIEAAKSFDSGLIVMGSRGHTGLARILLGSVARNVLLHTSASVLIVREPIRTRWPERARQVEELPAPRPVGAGVH